MSIYYVPSIALGIKHIMVTDYKRAPLFCCLQRLNYKLVALNYCSWFSRILQGNKKKWLNICLSYSRHHHGPFLAYFFFLPPLYVLHLYRFTLYTPFYWKWQLINLFPLQETSWSQKRQYVFLIFISLVPSALEYSGGTLKTLICSDSF